VDISENSVWRLTQHWGEAIKTVEAQEDERANGSLESLAGSQGNSKSGDRLGASMDGTLSTFGRKAGKS
jgi:hypothetical protein